MHHDHCCMSGVLPCLAACWKCTFACKAGFSAHMTQSSSWIFLLCMYSLLSNLPSGAGLPDRWRGLFWVLARS